MLSANTLLNARSLVPREMEVWWIVSSLLVQPFELFGSISTEDDNECQRLLQGQGKDASLWLCC